MNSSLAQLPSELWLAKLGQNSGVKGLNVGVKRPIHSGHKLSVPPSVWRCRNLPTSSIDLPEPGCDVKSRKHLFCGSTVLSISRILVGMSILSHPPNKERDKSLMDFAKLPVHTGLNTWFRAILSHFRAGFTRNVDRNAQDFWSVDISAGNLVRWTVLRVRRTVKRDASTASAASPAASRAFPASRYHAG